MDPVVVSLSPEFFKEHFSDFDRIDLWSSLVDACDTINKLCRLCFMDGDVDSYRHLWQIFFELDILCGVISDTFKGKEL